MPPTLLKANDNFHIEERLLFYSKKKSRKKRRCSSSSSPSDSSDNSKARGKRKENKKQKQQEKAKPKEEKKEEIAREGRKTHHQGTLANYIPLLQLDKNCNPILGDKRVKQQKVQMSSSKFMQDLPQGQRSNRMNTS